MMVNNNNNNSNKEKKNKKRLIVCLTGMPGAGKSTVASFLKEKGFSVLTMGDAVREEAKRQNLEPTDANLGKLMLKLRQDLGRGAVAHLILKKLERNNHAGKDDDTVVIIDGVRSIAEVEVLKKVGDVKLLAIHASQDTRFKHLKGRRRSDAPVSSEEFVGRDNRELSVGISEAIALADETLSNNDLTIEQLQERAYAIVQGWRKKILSHDDDSSIGGDNNNS